MAPATRRELLQLAAGAAALAACGGDGGAATDAGALTPAPDAGPPPVPLPETVPQAAAAVFPLGVAAGDPTEEGVLLWTRYAGAAPLELVVWRTNPAGEYAGVVVRRRVVPADGGFVQADLAGLAAATRHRYVFYELDAGGAPRARGFIGRFRTAPSRADAPRLVVGAVSCTKNGHDFAPIAQAGEREDLDLFLLLGDTSYNDGAVTLADYRAKWAATLSQSAYTTLRARVALIATWDDHDVDNNWDPATIAPAKLAAATQAFFEHLPVRTGAPGRLWRSVRWGRTLEVFVLDCRGERRTADLELVSRAQLDWLKGALSASSALFKLVMTSVPIGDFPVAFVLTDSYRWTGFAAQRTEILEHVDENGIGGVVWLSGDFHLPCAGRVTASGAGATQIELLVGPGAQNANPAWVLLGPPVFDWAAGSNCYTRLGLDPDTRSLRVTCHDGSDAIIWDHTYVV